MDRDDDETLLMAADFTGVARVAARTSRDGRHLGCNQKAPMSEHGRFTDLLMQRSSVAARDWRHDGLHGHPTDIYSERRRKDRVLRARIASAERWGRTDDRNAATAPARHGLRAKFEQQADPDGVLPIHERTRRADALQRAHMLRMTLASAKARRRRG